MTQDGRTKPPYFGEQVKYLFPPTLQNRDGTAPHQLACLQHTQQTTHSPPVILPKWFIILHTHPGTRFELHLSYIHTHMQNTTAVNTHNSHNTCSCTPFKPLTHKHDCPPLYLSSLLHLHLTPISHFHSTCQFLLPPFLFLLCLLSLGIFLCKLTQLVAFLPSINRICTDTEDMTVV